ncbi:MAG: hypothetical protein ACE5DI_04130 [Candidatus Micrarchaeia archaeon]
MGLFRKKLFNRHILYLSVFLAIILSVLWISKNFIYALIPNTFLITAYVATVGAITIYYHEKMLFKHNALSHTIDLVLHHTKKVTKLVK